MRARHRLEPRGGRPAPLVFKQGAHPPYAIRWYGATSLFGHFRNFIASAIASESVDSRDWMRPLDAGQLLANALEVLSRGDPGLISGAGAGAGPKGTTLLEAVDRPLWVDFVADTGDDRDVSQRVARMVFAEYVVDDGGADLVLPRGDVLLFGGDTAYPVATADEIYRRVVKPWNEVLRETAEETTLTPRTRVLLGIPGNHDWYDGLDGFGRFFRRRAASAERHERSVESLHPGPGAASARPRRPRQVGLLARGLHLDELAGSLRMIVDGIRAVGAFARGKTVSRRRRLTLDGYEAVQETSYWALPLAPGFDLWGVDRQLSRLDFRQRGFFLDRHEALGEDARVLFVAPDPAIAFGERYDPGARMLSACHLSFARDRILYLCGDLHQYERRVVGRSMHVIAGGGGAFLHGTRITPAKSGPAACAYPDAVASRQLVAQVPLKLMLGRAGYLVHIALALIATIDFGAGLDGRIAFRVASFAITIVIIAALYAIAGHQRTHRVRVLALAVPFGIVLGLMPMVLMRMIPHHLLPRLERDTGVMIVYAFLGSFVFGLYLATVAVVGLEMQQAFTVLGHPGFKHFVRLRVSPDGTIDAWVVGKDDPLASEGPWLIDRFAWTGARADPKAVSARTPAGSR